MVGVAHRGPIRTMYRQTVNVFGKAVERSDDDRKGIVAVEEVSFLGGSDFRRYFRFAAIELPFGVGRDVYQAS